MSGSTIRTLVTVSVTLGSGAYPSPLTVLSSGTIEPSAGALYGVAGLVGTIHGGSILNQGAIFGAGGTVTGGTGGAGVIITDSSLTNSAVIIGGAGGYGEPGGSGGDGVDIAGRSVTNTGAIDGGSGGDGPHDGSGGDGGGGVSLQDGGILTNRGEITGGKAGSQPGLEGLFYAGGGFGVYVTNSSVSNYGAISGGTGIEGGTGVILTDGRLTNDDLIQGGSAIGASFFNGGSGVAATNSTLTNIGTIHGQYGQYGGVGVMVTSSVLTNTGDIGGGIGLFVGGTGVDITGGVFTNTGSITGGGVGIPTAGTAGTGVLFHGGGTLTNAGYIGGAIGESGPADAVDFGTGPALLIDDPGASFFGDVVAQGGPATLELTSAAGAGSITGIGTSFTGFGTVTVDTGATWTVSGSVTGSGTISLGAGSDLLFGAAVAAASPVHFTANTGTLGLGDWAGFNTTVYGFQAGDAFDFTSITSAGSITAGVDGSNDLTLTSGGSLLAEIKLNPAQNFSADIFHATSDGHDGTLVTATPLCFLAGTLIDTADGPVAVERLAAGDWVLTASGQVRPVMWVGHGQVLATRGRRGPATPVIVRKGALGPNVPHTDLHVTKGHALWFDGVLIPVEFLINHRSILWDDRAQEVSVYHVELETHDLLLANGATTESYRDDGNRWLFQNANSGWNLPAQSPCAPVLTGGELVDAAWLRLLQRAGPRPTLPMTDDADLHLLVDGRRVEPASRVGAFCVFRLVVRPDAVRVASRAGAPQELGLARDPRCLGVALHRIIVRQGTVSRSLAAKDPELIDGFHAFEPENAIRWTDGDAAVPVSLFGDFSGPFEIVIESSGTTRYIDNSTQRVA